MVLRAWLAWLASLAADPAAIDIEAPRATAATAAAYAAQAQAAPPPAPPAPTPGPKPQPGVCKNCQGRGYVIQPDGHRTDCPQCDTFERLTCPDGKCPLPAKR